MPALSFEVGAIFSIDAQPAITSLEAIGQAFTGLEAMLQESVAATATAVNQMVTEIGRLADAWRAVGMEARAGVPGGGGGGGRGGGPVRGGGLYGPPGRPYWGEDDDWANARTENMNRNQIYSREEAAARRENEARDRAMNDGMVGPPGRPYWGEGDDWANARAEDQNFNSVRDNERRSAEYENQQRDAAERRRAATAGAIGGHVGGIFSGMLPLIAGAGSWMAEKGAMTEERALTQAMQEMGFHPGDPGYNAKLAQLKASVQTGTAGTIYSESAGANVLPGTAGQFGAVFATPDERLQNYSAILPAAMKFAEVAEQYHRGTMQESLKAAISYSHMTHRYSGDPNDPNGLSGGLDHLLALSLATGETVAGEQGILKYSVPLAMAAGVNPDDAAAMTGFFQVMGFSGTTAATGYGQMLMGLTQTGGPLAAQQHQHANELGKQFERALGMKPEVLHAVHQSRGSAHVNAMRELGLFDEQGHVRQDVAPGGRLNQTVFMQHIEEYLKSHDPMTDLSTLRNAFTVRGSREAALLQDPAVIQKLEVFLDNMRNVQSADQLQKELQEETLPRFMQMLSAIGNIGNTLATTTLPGLNSAFGSMNEYLAATNNFLRENPLIASIGGYALLIGGVATALGLFRLALSPAVSILSLLVPGLSLFSSATTTAAAAATEVGLGLSGMLGPITALLGALAVAGYVGGKYAADHLPDSISGASEARRKMNFAKITGMSESLMPPSWGADPEHHLGGAPVRVPGYSAGDPERHVPATKPPVTLTMEIRNTFNGMISDDTMKLITDKMTSALKGFLERASEMAQGASTSPFTQPGGGGW